MKYLPLNRIVKAIDGLIINNQTSNPIIKNVVLGDSKTIKDSTLVFFPEKSILENYQDVKFCAIVTQKPERYIDFAQSFTIIKVSSSKKSFEKFIKFYRNLFELPVVGITGTCGKTTTKEMVSSILKADMNLVKTIGSKNKRKRNLSYLMKINKKTDVAVIEVGVGNPGGIVNFDKFFKPSIGVITNIGVDHGLGFKTHQAYINEKAKMVQIINKNKGTIILNIDDENIKKFDLRKFEGRIIYFGLSQSAHFKASNIHYDVNGMKFSLHYDNEVFECKIKCFGTHNVYNALAALAISTTLGVPIIDAIQRLGNFTPLKRHLQIKTGINQCTLIDDTWNTNSKSIEAALEALVNLSKGKKTIAVLGDIEELGELSESEHKKIGSFIHKYIIDQLVTIGNESKIIAQQAIELGMNQHNIYMINKKEDLINVLSKTADANSVVLIKGSMRNSFKYILQKLIFPKLQ
ncbi:UDP-N-acetylmuramoyl-tripeptide--D-alanyl-D-alanine ligase [Ureibacillus composti]|nr:UDP-N-acetylmuramoyl-tripeptide--D-alanyl-D-alanine ligase [Ureibacillus composti]